MLISLVLLPIFGIFFLLFIPKTYSTLIKKVSLFFSLSCFFYSLMLFFLFDESSSRFQYLEFVEWFPVYNMHFFIGLDAISLFLILLSTLLINFCILISWTSIFFNLKEYLICFLLIDSFLIIVFSCLDLVVFYIFFEAILIPMFLIIGIWGARTRKIKAAYQFFLYTLFGSLFMLLGILIIFLDTGSTDFQILNIVFVSSEKEIFLWLAFFVSFAVKVPMMPLHIWLPEAHVEAPTAGSVVLAGVLLKLGTYGLLRFCISLFPSASLFFTPLVFIMSCIAILYTSITTLRQIDLKKIVAYSSVAHMGFVTIGIFTGNIYGIEGSLLIMISHGFISSALFLCIGILYDRYHSRLIKYYTGLVQPMPLFSFFFCFFSLANLGFPGFSSFPGEFLTLIGLFHKNTTACFLSSIGMILGAGYSLWLCNRVIFGSFSVNYIVQYTDIDHREFALLFILSLFTLFLGFYPEVILDYMHLSILNILQKI